MKRIVPPLAFTRSLKSSVSPPVRENTSIYTGTHSSMDTSMDTGMYTTHKPKTLSQNGTANFTLKVCLMALS